MKQWLSFKIILSLNSIGSYHPKGLENSDVSKRPFKDFVKTSDTSGTAFDSCAASARVGKGLRRSSLDALLFPSKGPYNDSTKVANTILLKEITEMPWYPGHHLLSLK